MTKPPRKATPEEAAKLFAALDDPEAMTEPRAVRRTIRAPRPLNPPPALQDDRWALNAVALLPVVFLLVAVCVALGAP